MCEYRYNGNVRFITMPKISYQEIVTADVSESGTMLHEFEFDKKLEVLLHTETNNGENISTSFQSALYGSDAVKNVVTIMPKQKVAENRKGLTRKSEEIEYKKVKTLTIDRTINDEALWYVEIFDGGNISRRPCKLSTLTESFNKQKLSWVVKVIGQWIEMNGRNYKQF